MNFKEYDNFINNHKYDITHFIIYYNLKCNDNFKKYNEEEIKKIIYFVYSAYMKDEQHTDLGFICDKAIEKSKKILDNKYDEFEKDYSFTKWDLLRECYE